MSHKKQIYLWALGIVALFIMVYFFLNAALLFLNECQSSLSENRTALTCVSDTITQLFTKKARIVVPWEIDI